MKKFKWNHIDISVISAILFFMAVITMIMSGMKMHEVNQSVLREEQIHLNRRECEKQEQALKDGSDYLTDEVRRFIATGDREHMDNYWKEIHVSQSREHAVEELQKLSVTEEEMELVERAKRTSDLLIPGETWAMRIAAQVYGIAPSELPPEVAAVTLTREELELPVERQHQLALNYIFGPDYRKGRKSIAQDLDEFDELLYQRKQAELDEAMNVTLTALHMAQYLNACMLLILLVSMISVFLLVTYPFQSYARRFETLKGTGFAPLQEKGSYNVIQFARAFNRLYEDWKKQDEQLKEERFRFHVAIENTAAIIFEYLPDTDTYKAYGTLIKAKERKPDGIPIERVFPHFLQEQAPIILGEDGAAVVRRLVEAKGGMEELSILFDGVPIWSRIHATAVYNKEQQLTKIIGKISNIDTEHEKEIALNEITSRDSLTGAYNQETGIRLIQNYMAHKQADEVCSLMVLDMDGFKQVNTGWGEAFGDAVLREIAGILRVFVRPSDYIVRLGGDEFMVFLKDCSKDRAAAMGGRIVQEIKHLTPTEPSEIVFSASMGICTTEVSDEYNGLYRCAWAAVKYAKEHGNGEPVCYQDVSQELEDGLLQIYSSEYSITKIERMACIQDDLMSFALDLLGKSKDLDDALRLLLARIGRYYSLDRVTIIDVDPDYLSCHVRYQWSKVMSESQLDNCYYISREELDIIMDSYDSENLCSQDIIRGIDVLGSLLHAGIWNLGVYEGTMSIEHREPGYQWTEEERHMLSEMVKIIASFTQRARADAVSQAKTEFLSRMSHEIRTPMNAIIGMTAIARKSVEEPEKVADCLNKIETANAYLMGLINDVLDMSKIESGKMQIAPAPVNLEEELENLEALMKPQALEKGLDFVIENGYRGRRMIQADQLHLNQILINLLGNAVKFTSQGSVKLCIEETEEKEDHVRLRFTVSDTGPGIDEVNQKRIFRAFEQESTDTSASFGGTGLGLAISCQLVRLMGGELQVRSTPGQGADFYFSLSFEMAGELTTGHKTELPPSAPLSGRILLVEDNELNREIAQEILMMHGFDVESAGDGSQAVKLFHDNPTGYFNAILMDIRMPVMDGFEATRQIRTMDKADSRTVPIISMTANAFDEDMKQSMESGMNGHLTKPIDVEKLIETLRQWMERPV